MLQDKYLPSYHFNEIHSITIAAPASKIFLAIKQLNFSDSFITRFLFKLRGLPTSAAHGIEGLKEMGFTTLEYIDNQELMLGLVGQFWKVNGNIQRVSASEFIRFNNPEYVKAIWNFELIPIKDQTFKIVTETRICCLHKKVRKNFSRYWFLIRPFSGLIRMEILKSIKRNAERQHAGN